MVLNPYERAAQNADISVIWKSDKWWKQDEAIPIYSRQQEHVGLFTYSQKLNRGLCHSLPWWPLSTLLCSDGQVNVRL